MSRRRAASLAASSDGDGDAEAKDWKRYTALLSQNYAKLDPDRLSHPLPSRDLTNHIKTLLSDLAVVAKEYRKCLDALNDAAGEMGECGAEELIKRADEEVRAVIGLQVEGEARKRTLERIRERANGGEEMADVKDMYEDEVAAKMDEWRKLSVRKRFGTDKAYKEFRERVWVSPLLSASRVLLADGSRQEGRGEQGAMPPLKSFLPQGPSVAATRLDMD